MIEWGNITLGTSSITTAVSHTFATAFPSACYSVMRTNLEGTSPNDGTKYNYEGIHSISRTGFYYNYAGSARTSKLYFQALGK